MRNVRKSTIFCIIGAIFCAVIFAMTLAFSIFLIGNKTDGYYTFGATKGYVVQDRLMHSESDPNSLTSGEMAYFSTDNDFERGIAKGQTVLFKKKIDGQTAVAARRVDRVIVKRLSSGIIVTTYELKSDNSSEILPYDVAPNEIVGVYTASSASAGAFFTFLNSFSGFVLMVLLPIIAALSVAIFLVNYGMRNRN